MYDGWLYIISSSCEKEGKIEDIAEIHVRDEKDAKLDVLAYLQTVSTVPVLTNLPERHLDNYLTNRDNLLRGIDMSYKFKDIDMDTVKHLHTFAHHIYDQMDKHPSAGDSSVGVVEIHPPPPKGYDVSRESIINERLKELVDFIIKCREKEGEGKDIRLAGCNVIE